MSAGLLALALVALAALSIIAHTLALGISPMPTSPAVRAAMLAQLPTDLTGDVFELGAGWGGLALALAQRLPSARVVAYERSPVPFAVLLLRARLAGRANLEVRWADLFEADLRGATAVVCYLFTGGMARLQQKLAAELPVGALVVSNTFALHGWAPEATVTVPDLYRTPVYRYRLGAVARRP